MKSKVQFAPIVASALMEPSAVAGAPVVEMFMEVCGRLRASKRLLASAFGIRSASDGPDSRIAVSGGVEVAALALKNTAMTFEPTGLRTRRESTLPTPPVARLKLAANSSQPSRYRFSAPWNIAHPAMISEASCGEGGPPLIERNFCRKRLYLPTRISLKRAITYPSRD